MTMMLWMMEDELDYWCSGLLVLASSVQKASTIYDMICIYSIYVSFSLKQNMQHNLSVELLPTIFSQFSNQEHMFFPRSFLPFRRVKNLPQIKFIGIDCQKRRSCTLSGDGS